MQHKIKIRIFQLRAETGEHMSLSQHIEAEMADILHTAFLINCLQPKQFYFAKHFSESYS